MYISLSEIWGLTDDVGQLDFQMTNLPEFGEIYEIVLAMAFKDKNQFGTADGEQKQEAGDVFVCSRFTEIKKPIEMPDHKDCLNQDERSGNMYRAVCIRLPAARMAGMSGRDVIRIDSEIFRKTERRTIELKNLLIQSLKNAVESENCAKALDESLPQILAWVFRNCDVKDKIKPERRNERVNFIRRYVHSGYNQRLTLEDLAKRMGLSVPYLSKFIKENIGQNFHSYVDTVRLSYTMAELEKNTGTFSSVAFRCGFPNIMAFNRAFQKIYNITPSAYRKQIYPLEVNSKPHPQLCLWICKMLDDIEENEGTSFAADEIHVTARAGTGRLYEKNWMKVLNLGYAEDLQKDRIQEHILRMKQELGFIYGRIENIFSQKLFVDIHSRGRFNFSRIDMILDFLVENGIIPFLNVSFTDKIIRKDVKSLFMKEYIVKGFDNDAQYRRLIREFFIHCVHRYGAAAVGKWRVELRWIHKIGDALDNIWLNIFESLYKTVKKCSPETLVGGFCFNANGDNEMEEYFLKQKKSICPDFISVVCYPYRCPEDCENPGSSPLVRDMDYMGKKLDELNILLEKNNYNSSMLYVTEWNISISNNNYLHDSCWKAAYILQTASECMEKAWCMAHWGCSDRTTEYYDSVRLLNGRNGLISRNGIRKPSFYAYDFLRRMGEWLIAKGQRYILTENREGSYFLVCNYLCPIREVYYRQPDERVDCAHVKQMFDSSKMNFCLKLLSVHEKQYRVETLSVSPEGGSVMDEWICLGHRDESSDLERSWLASISVPRYSLEVVQSSNGCIQVSTTLMANEIKFLRISPYSVVTVEDREKIKKE